MIIRFLLLESQNNDGLDRMEDVSLWESKFEVCTYSNKLLTKLDLLNKTEARQVDIQEIKKAIYYAKKYHGNQRRLRGTVLLTPTWGGLYGV